MDKPLKIEIIDGVFQISIGIDRIAYCVENDTGINNGRKVIDKSELAEDLIIRLTDQDDEGNTLFWQSFEQWIDKVYNDGSSAFNYTEE